MTNVRDSDTCLWLHNKLGTSNDSWTGDSICSQLNSEVLKNIKDCFPDLQTQVKLKLLLSFFNIPSKNVTEWKAELEEILEVAQLDSDKWVSVLGEMMKTYPRNGMLSECIQNKDNKRIFDDLMHDLKKMTKKNIDYDMLPLECFYMNKAALTNAIGHIPSVTKHFDVTHKSKAAILRAELIQKSIDLQNNTKKNPAPTVPVRSRGMPRKMTDTTPLKGLPSRSTNDGFSYGTNKSSVPRPAAQSRPLSGRKDCAIKLLDIAEQPVGHAFLKKRRRAHELDDSSIKRSSDDQPSSSDTFIQDSFSSQTDSLTIPVSNLSVSSTPIPSSSSPLKSGTNIISHTSVIKSVSAMPLSPPPPTPDPGPISSPNIKTYVSVSTSTHPLQTVIKTDRPYVDYDASDNFDVPPTPAPAVSSPYAVLTPLTPMSPPTPQPQQRQASNDSTGRSYATLPALQPLQPVQNDASAFGRGGHQEIKKELTIISPSLSAAVPAPSASTPPQVVQTPTTAVAAVSSNAPQTFSLTQEQLEVAQQMFANANKVTRPEKALILGFMAGSKDNPCPKLGNIVTIKLNERNENVMQQDGTIKLMVVETHFQMNYSTGEWKQIEKLKGPGTSGQTSACPVVTLVPSDRQKFM